MNTPTLPTHLGGLQHLAPDVISQQGDVLVRDGKPHSLIGPNLAGAPVSEIEDAIGFNVYRRIPVARQGDLDHPPMARLEESVEEAAVSKFAENVRKGGKSPLLLPTDAKARKATPIYSGFLRYFPRAIAEVARVSQAGNDQHNPGQSLHWDRSKSGDELDALSRHLLEAGGRDTDGQRHSAKLCWRALAALEKELEREAGA